MSAKKCFQKTYVKFSYLPPPRSLHPVDCKQIKVVEKPKIEFIMKSADPPPTGPRTNGNIDLMRHVGINVHCSVPSSSGVGQHIETAQRF